MRTFKRKGTIEAARYVGLDEAKQMEDDVSASDLQDLGAPIGPAPGQAWGDGFYDLSLETMHGPSVLKPGDWIAKGPRDWWPIDAAQFAESYEPLDAG